MSTGDANRNKTLVEKVEVLNGERGDRAKAAFRRGEAVVLTKQLEVVAKRMTTAERTLKPLPDRIKRIKKHIKEIQEAVEAVPINEPVTQPIVQPEPPEPVEGEPPPEPLPPREVEPADFNSLLSDVQALVDALQAVVEALLTEPPPAPPGEEDEDEEEAP